MKQTTNITIPAISKAPPTAIPTIRRMKFVLVSFKDPNDSSLLGYVEFLVTFFFGGGGGVGGGLYW
jgi:hypothetical protein